MGNTAVRPPPGKFKATGGSRCHAGFHTNCLWPLLTTEYVAAQSKWLVHPRNLDALNPIGTSIVPWGSSLCTM